jgi:tripartite-type tricarboxylate transporter receptor subunit TctC
MKRSATAALLGALVALASPAFAQEFPTKAVKLIVPVAPGGGTDVLARTIAERLREIWGKPVVVENRPGAGHIVGTTALAQSAPDGHTLALIGMPHTVNPALQAMPYRAIEDFTPITMLAQIPVVVVVHPSVEVKNIGELVQLARKKPGALNFAATSTNGAGHLAGELFKMRAEVDLTFVPYKGSAPALLDLVAGRVQVMFDALITAEPHIKSGTVRPIAITTESRIAKLPDVPTMIEAGYPGFTASAWLGLLGPAGISNEVADKINAAVVEALKSPPVRTALEKQGWEVLPIGTERKKFAEFLSSEVGKWAGVVKAIKLKSQ